jgi:hypothetical protein
MRCLYSPHSPAEQNLHDTEPYPACRPDPSIFGLSAQEIKPAASPRPANSAAMYRSLRSIEPSGDAFNIEGVTLKRDAGEFTLHKGTVYLYPPVNGHVTGAVFLGSGTFHLLPPGASEQHSLARLTKSNDMTQDFTTLVLRFTDETDAELKKATSGAAGHNGSAASASETLVNAFRKKIHENLDSRILEDVVSDKPGGLFLASFKGSGFFGRNILYAVDPQGAPGAAPDEVVLATFDEDRFEVWTAFHPSTPFEPRLHGLGLHVTAQTLDIGVAKNGLLTGSAVTTFTALHDNLRVVRLNLYPRLRVSGVYGPTGEPLDFVQESYLDDPQFSLLLKEPLAQGKSISVRTDYAGKEVVLPEGGENYYLQGGARESWYPGGYESLGGFSQYTMTFHVPKGLGIVATGKQISTATNGGLTTSAWKTDAPIAVAGFNMGSFKESTVKTNAGVTVEAYANTDIPDFIQPLARSGRLGTMNTTTALKQTLSEGAAAIEIYSNFFGPLGYDHVALTQQSACNYGQSWPMLVYLPICSFYDDTVRHTLGLDFSDPTYWTTVTPHEVSHQWWGQTVGFTSYRDQWMSEGFADFSASLFLLYTEPKMNSYREYWGVMHKRIVERNKNGVRPIDVGPVTMGARLNNEKTGENVYQMLVYSKGAYIVHMLEMLYWTPKDREEPFKAALHDFVTTYRNRAASTEDLKKVLERNLPAYMDVDGNKRLDWFFNAYVYGTALPHYTITSEFGHDGEKTTVHLALTQSNVTDAFHMLVPVYIDLGNGNITRLFNVPLKGNQTFDRTISLGKLDATPKRLLVNYNYDILSDN